MTTLEQQLAEAKEMLARIEQQIADSAKPKAWQQYGDTYWNIQVDSTSLSQKLTMTARNLGCMGTRRMSLTP